MDAPIASDAPTTQIFGNDTVTAPVGPLTTNTDNSAWTVTPNTFANSSPASSVVTSSNSAQNAVDNIQKNISGLPTSVLPLAPNQTSSTGAPTTYAWADGTVGHSTPDINGFGTIGYKAGADPSVTAAQTAGNQTYVQQEAALKLQRDQEIANLTDQKNRDTSALSTTQANETGGSTRNLLALGGYLGNNSFANSYLTSLQVSHEQAMQTLNAKYTSASQAAQNAFSDKDFALAEKMTANASAIQKTAQDRNDKFLEQTSKIQEQQATAAKTQFDEQNTLFQQQQSLQKEAQTFAKDNSITSPYYQYPGSSQVYDTRTGLPVTSQQYAAAGGLGEKGKYGDVQVVKPQDKHSAAYTEWQDYASTGGKLSFNDYMNMDANRKATRTTTNNITYGQQQQETQKSAVAATLTQWQNSKVFQGNNKISSTDYRFAKQNWIQHGVGTAKEFDDSFAGYADQSGAHWKQDYDITSQSP